MTSGVEFNGGLQDNLRCNVGGVNGFRLCLEGGVQVGDILGKPKFRISLRTAQPESLTV